jgi:hypothetical protein
MPPTPMSAAISYGPKRFPLSSDIATSKSGALASLLFAGRRGALTIAQTESSYRRRVL